METVTAKWSAVIIATGEKTRMYSSVSDVPPELRRQLETAMQREDAATIVIADESGRRELIRAFRGESPSLRASLRRFAEAGGRTRWLSRWPLNRIAAAALVAAAVAASCWIALK
ncbi:MAG: hypothetical protein U0Q16_12270 [Bryobacteraceae bacterium]